MKLPQVAVITGGGISRRRMDQAVLSFHYKRYVVAAHSHIACQSLHHAVFTYFNAAVLRVIFQRHGVAVICGNGECGVAYFTDPPPQVSPLAVLRVAFRRSMGMTATAGRSTVLRV